MRLPNGYGSTYKLQGNRRNPWIVRITAGWKIYDRKTKLTLEQIPEDQDPVQIMSDGKPRFVSKQIYNTVGYYPTRQEALIALADYHKDPFDLHIDQMTLEELYDKWSEEHFPEVSQSNINGCKASWKLLEPIKKMRLVDIKLDHLQKIVDDSGKNSPTLKKLKITLGLMYDYAVKHEILKQDKRDMIRYINIKKAGNPNRIDRTPFSKKEIQLLWKHKDDDTIRIILLMIYTGVRINEILDMRKENVHLDKLYLDITKAKTEAGIRWIPVCQKILPILQYWMDKDSEYLITNRHGQPFEYTNFVRKYWTPSLTKLGINHRPHDTRHTCASLLSSAGVDERIIRKIIGHKGQGVTETVYTHYQLEELLEAINMI